MFIQRVQKTSRRAVSSRQYNVPQLSTDSSNRVYANLEDEFLHAAESGDVHTITRIMKAHPEMDTECIDALGRSPLRLAVKNEHLEVVQVLLEKSSQQHMYEAALLAISAGHIQIAETILKHKKYLDMCRGKKKLGATDDFYKTAFPDSQFSPDITPLILASQKNQYEIVQLLLLRGETIMKPHKFSCACQECQKKIEIDQLRLAKYRLNAYRGLASEAYISLSSKDPISTAFELAAELRRFSSIEKHFKCEYIDLADQLSDYVVKLLDRIRTQKELELVLNKRGKPDQEKFSSLARFKLALKYKEKKFVAHPSCQQRVSKAWRYGMGKFERANWPKRVLIILAIVLMYPALVCLHIAESKRKEAKILQLPVVKFTCYSMSFLIFLLLICISSWEASVRVSKHRTFLKSFTPNATNRYKECRQSKQFNKLLGKDFPLRDGSPSLTDLLLTFWIIGMVSQECNQLYQTGLDEHISLYNIMDFLLLSAYIAALTLRFLLMIKFNLAVEVLKEKYADPCTMIKSVYWLNTDRSLWDPWDPRNVSEGLFAFANIMSFYRLLYFLPAFEVLGPLQISLRRMLKDIAKFALLFMLIIFAFLVGMHNLYWYFGERAPPPRTATNPAYEPRAVKSFNDLTSTLHTIFWALFGRGEYKAVELNDYTLSTDRFGYIIYGTYHIICVTILINMLIAMMTRSFTRTAEDSDREWKFARSMLYMDYIQQSAILPPPLNILMLPKAVYRTYKSVRQTSLMTAIRQPMERQESRSSSNFCSSFRQEFQVRTLEIRVVKELSRMSSSEEKVEEDGLLVPVESPNILRRLQVISGVPELDTLTYQQTVQRLVQRYILDMQREAEVIEDDVEVLKREIFNFSHELDSQTTTASVQEELKEYITKIQRNVQKWKENASASDRTSAQDEQSRARRSREAFAKSRIDRSSFFNSKSKSDWTKKN